MPPTKPTARADVSRTREYLTELDALPYHDEDLRPKALLLTALTEVQAGQEAQLRKHLEDFVQRYPETPLMPYASNLLNRPTHGAHPHHSAPPHSPRDG